MNTLSHKKIWRIAWPIILSNITVPLVGAIDTAVIGQLPGANNIAAVALGAIIFDFLFWGFNFLKIGTSGLSSQALGANDQLQASKIIVRAFAIALVAAGLVIIVHKFVLAFSLNIYKTEAEVAVATASYFNIRIWGSVAVFFNFVILGCFIALQTTRFIFLHQLLLNLTNICLDLLFVLKFDMGIEGVAIATVIANYTACGFGLFWLFNELQKVNIQLSFKTVFNTDFPTYIKLMQLNANIFIRSACLVFSFAFLAYMGSKLGTVFLAANAILLHFQSIMAYSLDGFADATESLSGRAYGKRSLNELSQAMRLTTQWAVCAALLCCLLFLLFGHQIIAIFSIDTSVINTARDYLPWLIISPIISVWSFQLDGIYVGTTHSMEMRNGMLLSTLLFVICAFVFVSFWQNHGLWFAFILFMGFRGLILGLWYPRIPRSIRSY